MLKAQRKAQLLGMPHGTAASRLRKQLLFKYVKKAGDNVCYRCAKKIRTVAELSIDHKEPWQRQQNGSELFWDLENVAFSHLRCNVDAGRIMTPWAKHGSLTKYKNGCRCTSCRKAKAACNKKYRLKILAT